MVRLTATFLALICNAVLVLPPGWCCMIAPAPCAGVKSCCGGCPSKPTPPRNEKPKPLDPSKGCCCANRKSCCASQSKPTPPRNEKPKPFGTSKCCCADRHAADPHDTEPDFPPPCASHLVEVPDDSAANLWAGCAYQPAPPVSIAPHVWQCVWLC
jgi:hypothetical protein